MFDFESDESLLLLNPRLPREECARLKKLYAAAPRLAGHVWLATSGTSGALKLVALAKKAILASAAAVNRHLGAEAGDPWACVLPEFHVGGLAIFARAFLAQSRVVRAGWDAQSFAGMHQIAFASLVPAQVSDLVAAGLRAPKRLRAVVVGGGALSGAMYERALQLGWPLLPSYGLTECASQVATARPGSPDLVLLDHMEARADEGGRLCFRSESLFTGYASAEGFADPKVDGWFRSEDLGSLQAGILTVRGRQGDFVKIGGESVDLTRLGLIVESLAGSHAVVVAAPDARLGAVIELVVDATVAEPEKLRDAFDERVYPFERARRIRQVEQIPRSGLGKVLQGELMKGAGDSLE